MSNETANQTFDAPWTDYLKHRSEPNRIRSLHTPSPGHFEPSPGREALSADTATETAGHARDLAAGGKEHSYYDLPMLKPPVWKWEIAWYFYLGGMSGGAYVLSRIADRFGGQRFSRLSRIGSYVAVSTLAPCPPLLIADLGDPKRFHHMLRVFKPSSPMNFGTWLLTAYGAMATFEAVRQFTKSHRRKLDWRQRSALEKLMNNGTLLVAHDAMGVPFALLVASYTGVLLSCTSNPLWAKNTWLAPLFAASALSTGAEVLSLALDLWPGTTASDQSAQPVLQAVDTVAHGAELALMRAFMKQAGEKAQPLRSGGMKRHHQFATGAIVAAEILKRLPTPKSLEKPSRMLSAALGLAGGLAMRWAMVFGGHEAANNPRLSRLATGSNGGAS